MRKKNKGFTLIELLTVIAILAIILLIAAPTILGVLDKARKNTFKNQALLYVSGLKTQMALSATGDSDIESKLNWTTDGNTRTTTISITDLNDLIMDTEGLTSGSIKITEDTTTNKYTYTLVDVANSDYKIVGSVPANELDVEDIYKADEKVEDKEETDEPVTPTVYYEFGDPTTSSTTDYTTLVYPTAGTQAKVFVKLDTTDSQKSVCILRNDTSECFKNNNYENEVEHVKEVFGESNCTSSSSSVICSDADFNCAVYSYGRVDCSVSTARPSCSVIADDSVYCVE